MQIDDCKRQGGFTLIELIMVLFIIGLMSSMVSLSISGTDAPAREERDRLVYTLEEARDYAILNGHLLRLRPNQEGSGYEFAERRIRIEEVPVSNGYLKPERPPAPLRIVYWDSEIDREIFKTHKVTEGVKLEFEGGDGRGSIFIAPSGDVDMGIVRVSDSEQSYDIFINEEGVIVAKLIEKEQVNGQG